MTLTFLGHETSSVTWPFESQWAISYWWSIGPKSLSQSVFKIFGVKHIWYLGHDLDHSGSHDVIVHVTIWFPGSYFLYGLDWHQVRISNRCRDYGPHLYWGHDLELSKSRDVISHETIRIPMGHFPLVVHWTQTWVTQVSISIRFRDISP